MSAPYAEDIDIKTDGTTRSNYKNLKNLRLEQRSTKSQYECITSVSQHRLSLLINANQLLTLSLIEGCSQHELLQHVASFPAAVHNRETFGYLSIEEVTGAQLLMMSYFDLYNSAFRSVQSRASFVTEAAVKIFDPPDWTLTFQQHTDLTRKQFEEFAAYVKTHSLDTTEKLLDHLHANKLVRFKLLDIQT